MSKESRFIDNGAGLTRVERQCDRCAHLDRGSERSSCKAFPVAIPDKILIGAHDHTQPFTGDGGVMFKNRSEG